MPQVAGAASRHALGWRLTAEEEAAAIAEVAQAAAGRGDLLAEQAGLAVGFARRGGLRAARYRQIAELCMAAGLTPERCGGIGSLKGVAWPLLPGVVRWEPPRALEPSP